MKVMIIILTLGVTMQSSKEFLDPNHDPDHHQDLPASKFGYDTPLVKLS